MIRMIVTLLLALLLCAFCAAAPAPAERGYLAYVSQQLPLLDAAWDASRNPCPAPLGKPPCDAAASLAAAHALYYNCTGAPASLARVSSLMRQYVASWRNATANGTRPNADQWNFFACRPGAVAARALLTAPGAAADWGVADLAGLRDSLAAVCSPQMYGVFNQPASRASGVALFAQLFPDSDANGTLRAYAEAVWGDWTSTHAYGENSPDYNAIFLRELFSLGATLDPAAAAADLAHPLTRATLEHFLDLIAPSGVIPAHGDAWGGAGGSG